MSDRFKEIIILSFAILLYNVCFSTIAIKNNFIVQFQSILLMLTQTFVSIIQSAREPLFHDALLFSIDP